MIDVMVTGDKGFAKIGISGNTFDLTAETLMCVRQIYKAINEQSHSAAEAFREVIVNNIHAAFLSAEELNEENKKGETIQKKFDEMFGGSSVQDLQKLCDNLERLSKKFSEEGDDE